MILVELLEDTPIDLPDRWSTIFKMVNIPLCDAFKSSELLFKTPSLVGRILEDMTIRVREVEGETTLRVFYREGDTTKWTEGNTKFFEDVA